MAEAVDVKNPFLVSLGERVRVLRARRGMTRKAVAMAADVSERHLASLEYGEGNASILVLLQVANALQCTLAELLGDVTTTSPEWLLLREMLGPRSEGYIEGTTALMGYYRPSDEIPLLAKVKVPTLIIWGVMDKRKPAGEAEELSGAIAGSRLVKIENAGHYVHEEGAEEVAAFLIANKGIWQ